jgi:hypothetical protein
MHISKIALLKVPYQFKKGRLNLMDYEIIKQLITEAQNNGNARYEAWDFSVYGNILNIYHNGGKIAHFYMTAFEKGSLEWLIRPSTLESKTVNRIESYLLGTWPHASF